MKTLGNLLLLILSLWIVFCIGLALFEITIYFPFYLSQTNEIPYHRWQSVRIATLMTFIYFVGRHFFLASRAVFPIKFLDVYLKCYVFSCMVIFFNAEVGAMEWLYVVFFFFVSLALHYSTSPSRKKIFHR